MDVDEIRRRIAKLAEEDPETSHWEEDELCADVLKAISEGHPAPAELAKEVLKVRELELTRWYA